MSYVLKIPVKLEGQENGKRRRISGTSFIRYADDFVIMHHDRDFLEYCKTFINTWLNDIGLELKPSKTRMIHTFQSELSDDGKAGFDFLGFYIQQHKAGKYRSSRNSHKQIHGFNTLIIPTKDNQKQHQERLGEIIRRSQTEPQVGLIAKINPIIRGWANYYQHSDIKTVRISSKQDYLTGVVKSS